jgi:hypothetical protein
MDLGVLGRLQWELGKECAWVLLVFYSSKDGMRACFVLCSPVTESMKAFWTPKGPFREEQRRDFRFSYFPTPPLGCGIRSGKLLGSF